MDLERFRSKDGQLWEDLLPSSAAKSGIDCIRRAVWLLKHSFFCSAALLVDRLSSTFVIRSRNGVTVLSQ